MNTDDIRANYERAYARHMSNLDASISATHDPLCNADDLRRYADACDVSREAWQAAMRNLREGRHE